MIKGKEKRRLHLPRLRRLLRRWLPSAHRTLATAQGVDEVLRRPLLRRGGLEWIRRMTSLPRNVNRLLPGTGFVRRLQLQMLVNLLTHHCRLLANGPRQMLHPVLHLLHGLQRLQWMRTTPASAFPRRSRASARCLLLPHLPVGQGLQGLLLLLHAL